MQSKQILFSCLARAQNSTTHLGKEIGLNSERTDIQQKMHGWAVGDFVYTVSVSVESGQITSAILQLIQHIECGSGYLVQGIIPSLPPGKALPLSTRNKIIAGQAPEGAVARSNDNFKLPIGPGILVGDVDRQMSQAQIYAAYKQVIPELDRFPFLIRASSSAGLVRNGQYIKAPDQANHVYLPTQDASLNAQVLEIMHKMAWIYGHGWVFISKAGTILERSIVDLALRAPSQPVYVSYCAPYPGADEHGAAIWQYNGATVSPAADDIVQMTKQVTSYEGDGSGQLFDPQAYIEAYERDKEAVDERYRKVRDKAVWEAEPEARRVREQHIRDLESYCAAAGIPQLANPGDVVRGHQQGVLVGSEPLHLGPDRWTSVSAVLTDPVKFNDVPLADPVEPLYNNSFTVAKIYTNLKDKYAPMRIRSMAHGGDIYRLLWDHQSASALIEDPPEGFDLRAHWPKILLHSAMGPVDTDSIKKSLTRKLGTSKPVLEQQYRKYEFEAAESSTDPSIGRDPVAKVKTILSLEKLKLTPEEFLGYTNLKMPKGGDQDPEKLKLGLSKISAMMALVRIAGKATVLSIGYDKGLDRQDWRFDNPTTVDTLFSGKRLHPNPTLHSSANPTYFKIWMNSDIPNKQYDSATFIPTPGKFADSHILKPNAAGHLINPYPVPPYRNCILPPPDTEDPSVFNLYRGLAIRPEPGDWGPMRYQFEQVWCGGDPERAAFLHILHKAWFFYPQLAQVLALLVRSSEEGVGKSSMNKFYSRVWGMSALHLQDQERLKRNFNAVLANRMLILVDESVNDSKDKTFKGQLKNLITSSTLIIEKKGHEVVELPHYANFIFFSNEQRSLPFGLDSRRVLPMKADFPEELRDLNKRAAHFKALHTNLDGGGPAAYLHFLSELPWEPQRLEKPQCFTDASNLAVDLENETVAYRFLVWMVMDMLPSTVTLKEPPDGHADKQPEDASSRRSWYLPRGVYSSADTLEELKGTRGLENMLDEDKYPSSHWDDYSLVINRADLTQIYEDWQRKYVGSKVLDSNSLWSVLKHDFHDMADVPPMRDKLRLYLNGKQQRLVLFRNRKICAEVLNRKQREKIDFGID